MTPPIVVATTRPFFERATAIVEETWHELDRIARALDQCVAQRTPDIQERMVFESLTVDLRQLARRLERTEVVLSAYLPTP